MTQRCACANECRARKGKCYLCGLPLANPNAHTEAWEQYGGRTDRPALIALYDEWITGAWDDVPGVIPPEPWKRKEPSWKVTPEAV